MLRFVCSPPKIKRKEQCRKANNQPMTKQKHQEQNNKGGLLLGYPRLVVLKGNPKGKTQNFYRQSLDDHP